jgi:hypothetical protein
MHSWLPWLSSTKWTPKVYRQGHWRLTLMSSHTSTFIRAVTLNSPP